MEDYERASDYCVKVIEMPGNSHDLKTLKDKAKYRQVRFIDWFIVGSGEIVEIDEEVREGDGAWQGVQKG